MHRASSSDASTKASYRICNWQRYNDALVRRGSLTLGVEEATWQAWRYPGPTQQEAQFQDSDLALECLLTLRAVDHLTLGATAGFARSLFELMDLDLPVPASTSLGRRATTVRLPLPKRATGPLPLVLDSPGLKVEDQGEGKVRQPSSSPRRTWRNLPLAIAPQTHENQAALLSDPGVRDETLVPPLLEPVENPRESRAGEGVSDRRTVYAEWDRRNGRALIPPRREAKVPRPGNTSGPRLAREENLRRLRQRGRKEWQEESGSHRRSLGETAMFRVKTIFGGSVASRRPAQQVTEVGIRCRALKVMTHQGMPRSERVA